MTEATFEYKLVLITDSRVSKKRDNLEIVKEAIKGGAEIIILRERNWNKVKLREEASKLVELCHQNNVLFIVGIHVDVAITIGADGVHLEKEGNVLDAREQAGDDFIIGKSAHSIEEAIEADHEETDYITLGPIYPTREEDKTLGPEMISAVIDCTHKPVIAVGGIDSENVDEVLEQGAISAGVTFAIVSSSDVEGVTREISTKLKNQ